MILKLIYKIIVVFAVLASCHATAAIIKTTADFTMTSVVGGYTTVQVDDVFKFSAIYDDAGTYMRETDTLSNCLDTHIEISGVVCTASVFRSSDFTFLSNATTNFRDFFMFSQLLSDGNVLNEYNLVEKPYSMERAYNTTLSGLLINIQEAYLFSGASLNEGASGAGQIMYRNSNGGFESSVLHFRVSNIKTSPNINVPEPSTLAIFTLCIIGLTLSRTKKT